MLFSKNESNTTYIQLRVKESEKEALKEIADKHNMTLTDFIKKACNVYADILEKNEK
jgi:uncharacterized protein (DUF1778 family)